MVETTRKALRNKYTEKIDNAIEKIKSGQSINR